MHKNGKSCFAVIYIPFYALQCAQQKRVLEKCALENGPMEQLAFDGLKRILPEAENKMQMMMRHLIFLRLFWIRRGCR